MGEHGTTYRQAISALIAHFDATLAALDPALLSGSEFLSIVSESEAFGRRADALRARIAAESETRIDGPVDVLGAAGYASAKDAVAKLAGTSVAEASRRIRVGRGMVPGVALSGAPTAPRHPAVAAAVAAGHLGVEAADVIMQNLDAVASRVDPVVLAETEDSLVFLAAATDTHPPLCVDLVRVQIAAFVLRIDPDGARPREKRAQRKRHLTFGHETLDGLIPVSGLLIAEIGGTFKRLVDSHARKVTFTDESEPAPAASDDRTRPQRNHDTLADILSAASRVKDAPELAGSAPAVLVTVTATDLEDGRGAGYIDGHATPISIKTAQRLIDSRGLQTVTLNAANRVLALGSTQRCFTSSQRRAITARDGGCVIPGCTTPAGWCDVHHVVPWRAGGDTHTDNGVLLCWGHHQRIDSGPWRLSMPHGVPHVLGPGYREWTPTLGARTRAIPPRALTG